MSDDTDCKKLSIEERCDHKIWKVRKDGYEEAAKIFLEIEDEKSPEWNKFTALINKMVTDTNVVAQEKGLEAAILYIENCAHAGKIIGQVMQGIIKKCIASAKPRTKELAVEVVMTFIKIDKQEQTIEELTKGMEHKNPKIVAACVSAATMALRNFGNKVIHIKPLIEKLVPLMADREKAVRDEGKLLTVEIYRWIGVAVTSHITCLSHVILSDLESEFNKLKDERHKPLRFLKGQEERQQINMEHESTDNETGSYYIDCVSHQDDSEDLTTSVDILSELPQDFFEKLEAKAWTVRKEPLVILEKLLTENPNLECGDYGNVVSALKKIINKDSNVVLVAMAVKCLGLLASRLGKKFSTYALVCFSSILEKFKEKKSNVVMVLREVIDAVYSSTTLEAILDSVVESLNNKNPGVKSETVAFLARAFKQTSPAMFNKKLLKVLMSSLIKTLNESDPVVRDNSAEAIGNLLKLLGEKAINCFLTDVDPLKLAKIKEYRDKAVLTIKKDHIKSNRPSTALVKNPIAKVTAIEIGGITQRGTSNYANKPNNKMNAISRATNQTKVTKILESEKEMTPEEIMENADKLLSVDILTGLSDSNWEVRLNASECLMNDITTFDPKTPGISQILSRTITDRKPGLKDMNFQVCKIKLDIIRTIAEAYPFTITNVNLIINDIIEKLPDIKNGSVAGCVLTAFAQKTKLDLVISKVLSFAFQRKSPKLQLESLNWVRQSVSQFGQPINVEMFLHDLRKGIQSSYSTVRGATICLIGMLSMYTDKNLITTFDDEKPIIISEIQTEIDKYAVQKPSAANNALLVEDASPPIDEKDIEFMNAKSPPPCIDISAQITESLLAELSDKDWNIRYEGLCKLQQILNKTKFIKPGIGDLPTVLAQRLIDTNPKIVQITIVICEQLAVAIGPACKVYINKLFPAFLLALGDSKAGIRLAILSCINVWVSQCGCKEFFTGGIIANALKSGNLTRKAEVWGWLADLLPNTQTNSLPKEELSSLLPHLFVNITDRNADIRKNANEAASGIMIHLGYDSMLKLITNQKQSSVKDIKAILHKIHSSLPITTLSKSKHTPSAGEELPVVKRSVSNIQKQSKGGDKATVTRYKEEESDVSPLLLINNLKTQRILDEQKQRGLKWTLNAPREEYTEFLREQTAAANVNKELITKMFHSDFKYHLLAIDSLISDLPINTQALVCNLDLILKWLTLRFSENNSSVLLKAFEYLGLVFGELSKIDYVMTENEGKTFVPHLIAKIGDTKNLIRHGVHTLLRQIVLVYSYTKVFGFLIEAIKSKNSRQRAECLDELGYLIQTYGMNACQPSQQLALKEIAHNIADRDNCVRNAALNCIVNAYFLIGDRVYKLIGKLSEKHLSMLSDRLKRAKKPKPPTLPEVSDKIKQANNFEQQGDTQFEGEVADIADSPISIKKQQYSTEENERKIPKKEGTSQTLIRQATFDQPATSKKDIQQNKPSDLDSETLTGIEKACFEAPPIDLSLLWEPIKMFHSETAAGNLNFTIEKYDQSLIHNSTTPIPTTTEICNRLNVITEQFCPENCVATDPDNSILLSEFGQNVTKLIKDIGSPELATARAALIQLTAIIESPDAQPILQDYVEMILHNILVQLKYSSVDPIIAPLLTITYKFFDSKTLATGLTVPSLKNTMSVLLPFLAEKKLGNDNNPQYMKIVNEICLKVLEKANFTNLTCALIRSLKETCLDAILRVSKLTDLLIKCLWRCVKRIQNHSRELIHDDVLYEVQDFLLTLPPVWWSQHPPDVPLQTINTVIYNLTKNKWPDIYQSWKTTPKQSELHSFVFKHLQKIQCQDKLQEASTSNDVKFQISSDHETISRIIKMISDKETSHQGFLKLYEFKLNNPHVEISTLLNRVYTSFQNYIVDGLAKVEGVHEQRQSQTPIVNTDSTCEAITNSEKYVEDDQVDTEIEQELEEKQQCVTRTNTHNDNCDANLQEPLTSFHLSVNEIDKLNPDFWMCRLEQLKARAHIDLTVTNEPGKTLSDNSEADDNLSDDQPAPTSL